MTQAITIPAAQPAARPTLKSDVVAPLGDALWATTQLNAMNWITSEISYANQLDDARLGKGMFGGRGPMRRSGPPSPILKAGEAQRQITDAGLSLEDIPLSKGETVGSLKIKIDHTLKVKKLEGIVARADKGIGTQFLLGATGLAVDFADPVNLATMAIPGVVEVKAAALIAKAAARLGPTISKYAVRAGVGAYEGAVSSAILEPIDYAVDQQLGNDHTLADAAWNIGLGALGGSVMRVGGGAVADLYHSQRLRQVLGVDKLCAAFDDVLLRFGQGHPVQSPQDARLGPAANPEHADAVVAPTERGEFPPNSILAIPSQDGGGMRVELGQFFSVKDWIREYESVESLAADAMSPSKGRVFRIQSGNDVIVLREQVGHSDGGEVFEVQRLNSDHSDYGKLLSRKKDAAEIRSWEEDKRTLYVRPPEDLAKRFSDGLGRRMDMMERKRGKRLFRYSPPKEKDGKPHAGHSVRGEIGLTAHNILKGYIEDSGELLRVKRLNGQEPDAGHFLNKDVELKPDTVSGRELGKGQGSRYQRNRRRETVILLYSTPDARIEALNARVLKAWNLQLPGWNLMEKGDFYAAWAELRGADKQPPRVAKSRELK